MGKSESESCSVMSDSLRPHVPYRIIQGRILEWIAVPFSQDLPNPGIEPRTPALQADALSPEPPGQHKNTRMGNLPLSQGILLTQELNQDLRHCSQIL